MPNHPKKHGLSVDNRKARALKTIQLIDYEPPKYAVAQYMGITRATLRIWKDEDEQFANDLEEIMLEKRADLVGEAHKGLQRCIDDNQYPAIRDVLRTQDPDNWSEPEDTKVTTVNIMYLDIGPGRGKDKPKKIVNGRHKLK